MKRNLGITVYLFILMMLAGACTDNDIVNNAGGVELDENGLATVRLNVSIADAGAQTRDDVYNDDTQTATISTGANINMLIYAVYDVTDETIDPVRLDYYQANYNESNAGHGYNYGAIKPEPTSIGAGQTVVGFKAKEGANPYRYTLILKVDPEKKYKVAFWAQNSGCKAYDTSDMTNVKVSYKPSEGLYSNNDESRDAFSGVSEIMGVGYVEQEVVLQRPFAQINIGTTGADYANLIYYELMVPTGITVTQSKVKIKGVANRFNVLNCWATTKKEDGDGETWVKDEIKENEYRLVADFDWANLPAWINLNQTQNSGLPSRTGFTYNKEQDNRDDDPFVKLPEGKNNPLEAFLKVRLNGNTENDYFAPYWTDYPTVEFEKVKSEQGDELVDEDGNIVYNRNKIYKYLTETFKYLSMCYVLVPTDTNDKGEPVGATVDLSFNLQQELKDGKDPVELTERTLYSVPVQANYRTNILGGLYDNVLDPTSIFNFYQLPLILVDEIKTYKNSRFYAVNLSIVRPHNEDVELTVKRIDPDPDSDSSSDEEEGYDVEVDNNEITTFPIFFTGDKVEFVFEVNDNYTISVSSNMDTYHEEIGIWIKNNWDQWFWKEDINENKGGWDQRLEPDAQVTKTKIALYPGATASQFTISITKYVPPIEEEENTDKGE